MKRILVIFIGFVLMACSPSIQKSNAFILEREVTPLLNAGSLSSESWPQSVVELKPQAVYRRAEGIYIKTSSMFTEERGVFVLNPDSAFSPPRGTDPSYEQVTDRVFIYRIAG